MMKRIRKDVALIAVYLSGMAVASAQNLTGTILAADTGAALSGVAVLAIQKTASVSQKPSIYKVRADVAGQYAMTVAPGQYLICVQAAGLYLDPCQWSAANIQALTGTGAANVPLHLQKGAQFILRVHDTQHFLPQVESGSREAIAAFVTGGLGNPHPLPIVYETGGIRDFGAIVPMNISLNVAATSTGLHLGDTTGAELSPQGTSFRITPADFQLPVPFLKGFNSMFRAPDAKVVHVYTTGRK